jgi:amino acid adenylation domain-containing protein/thioester reductase-like protein
VPLSLTQQRLWLLHQLDPSDTTYHNVFTVRLAGPLDSGTLAAALTEIARRHEILRTRFPASDPGEPRQEVLPPEPIPLRFEDFSDRLPDEREQLAARVVAQEQLRPYDLTATPPVRYALIRLTADDHVVVIAMHHLVCDAGSFAVLERELDACYIAKAAGREVELDPPRVQYADFALWQRDRADAGRLRDQLGQCVERLRGAPPVADLSALAPHSVDNGRGLGAELPFTLEPTVTARVQQLGANIQATPFMVLFAAYALLIAQLGAGWRDDLVIGLPFDQRTDRRLQHLVGMFISTLAVRVRCPTEATFRRLLGHVRDALLDAYGNAEVPFDWLVRELAPTRDPDRNPVFQVMFQLQHGSGADRSVAGLPASPFQAAGQPAKFDLTLNAVIADGVVRCGLNYPSGRFAPETIGLLCAHYRSLVEAAVAEPDRPIGELPRFRARPETPPVAAAAHAPAHPVRGTDGGPPRDAVESTIAAAFAEVLGVARVSVTESFFDLGGHSLLAIRLMRRVNQELETKLPMNLIFQLSSVASLAAAVTGDGPKPGEEDFVRDVSLDLERPSAPWSSGPPRDVLLTGATGLLGAHVLAQTLRNTDAAVWCLVRAGDEDAGRERVHAALRHYGRWDATWAARIHIICGDLDEPLLGLDPDAYRHVAGTVDTVFHIAASVNLLDSYSRVRATNVLGTREVLRLAACGGLKPVHYVSSISTVVAGGGSPDVLPEDWRSDPRKLGGNGYLQSKWVAEEIVRLAQELGVPTAIYRPSRLSGDSVTGKTNDQDAFWHYVRAWVELAAVPAGEQWQNLEVNLVPVDYVAAAFVRIALTRPPDGTAYHLTHPAPTNLSKVLDQARKLGYRIREVPYPQWRQLLVAAAGTPAERPTSLPSVELLESVSGTAAGSPAPADVSRANTEAALIGSDIVCPDLDEAALRRYLTYFIDSGLLPPPSETEGTAARLSELEQGIFPALWRSAVARWPQRPAARHGGQVATFAELDEGAAAVAAALRARGVRRGDRVAVWLGHGVPLLETILGVLRAGAAFVPVDHRQTDQRARRMLAAARVRLAVVGGSARVAELPCPVVTAAALREEGAAGPDQVGPEVPGSDPSEPAYILFTSGSTGEPRGVVVSHRALARYLRFAARSYFRFGGNGAPLYSSVAFDLTVTSIFAPLVAGRPVHLVPADNGIDGIVDLLASGVSFDLVKLTPSHLRLLVAALEDRPVAGGVACLVVGGEALAADVVRAWRRLSPGTVVVNEYGPTESTVGCCVYEIGVGDEVPDPIPIGRAIPSVTLHVLDDQRAPVRPGGVGELFIGGETLAEGYLGQPALTASRFSPDPFAAGPAGRLYRTGDLVRRGTDGELYYLGRLDRQVKIRGYRIEPGEIESAIRSHRDVRDCVVRAWRRGTDDVRLVAYVVPRRAATAGTLAAALAPWLRDELPEYLVPRHVVEIRAIPRTFNGKVDADRLPEPVVN